jgi:hypothetical protein
MFTRQELENIRSLIASVSIKGADAVTVAGLLLKINELLKPEKPTGEDLENNGFKKPVKEENNK